MSPKNPLVINEQEEIEKITSRLKQILHMNLHRRGLIVAISGGVDSAVSAALCVKALGAKKIYGLLLPEHDSSSDSVSLGEMLAEQLGIEYIIQNIAPTLEAIGCYQQRDEAMKLAFPEYESDWKSKIVITGGIEGKINRFKLIVQNPSGDAMEKNLRLKEYLKIVAATNYKQRIRKTIEYYHADRLNYAVVGTPNRVEYDQGFFVKNGDGSADVKPIAHLYKTQVYALAEYLGLPNEICSAVPTTDTYSLPQGQDEFYFTLPYEQMDVALWSYNHNVSSDELADLINITVEQARFVYTDIEKKRNSTAYHHAKAILVEPVTEV